MVTESHDRDVVQVYETDSFVTQRVIEYLAAGLGRSERCLVIATEPHRRAFADGLARAGTDVARAIESGRLVMLDARATLDQVMVGDLPDAERFDRTIGGLIAQVGEAGRRVRAFGDIVDLLWRDGRPEAALRVEFLWNQLARGHELDLLCAYTIGNFYKTSSPQFREVCEVRDQVLEPEHRGDVSRDEHVRLLLSEIARRAEVERELRAAIHALHASAEAERARVARTQQLQQATAALASAVSLGELCDVILATVSNLAGSAATVIYIADAEGRFRLHGARNIDSRWAVLPLDAPLPLATALTTGRPLWLDSRDEVMQRYPNLTDDVLDRTRSHGMAALPFVQRGRVIGGIGLSFETARAFTDEERTWFESFAAQCTLAIERAQMYSAEHKARTEAESLLRIAESLGGAHLDLEAILRRVTDEATALVGATYGAFFYNIVDDRGEQTMLYTLAGARMPRNLSRAAQSFDCIIRIDDVRNESRRDLPGLPAGELPVASYLAVPVRSRTGNVIGGLVFGHPEPARFTAQHETLLHALAVTAAVAVDNAELYRTARDAEDAQRKTVEQLVETVRMNELFTGVLAHDLRSPLAAVMTAVQLMIMRTSGTEKTTAERVLNSARRMARMIEQLLDFTRIRMGTGVPVEPKPTNLEPLIAHVVDELRAAHPNRSLRLTVEGDPHGTWDDDRLSQAFSNLIGNAAQHGRPEADVTIHIDGAEPDTVYVSIHNAGSIPEELQSRIFEPMIGGQRRHDGTRGLGLGLFITREIAASHGGLITLSSSPDAGTTFTMTLPRVVEARRAEVPAMPRSADHPLDAAQRARLLVDSVRDAAIFLIDAGRHIQTWSPTATRMLGWTRDEIAERPLATLYAEPDLLDIQLGRAAELGHTEHEAWFVRRDGTRMWGSFSVSAIRNASSKLVGYAGVLRDQTVTREAQEALEDYISRTRLMIDSVRDYAIIMLDVDGVVRTWSRGAQLLEGYTPGEIIGCHVSTFYPREERDTRPQQLLQRAADDGRVEDEGWRVRKDGSRFWADVVITALRDDTGTLRGYAKITRDLTDRRRAEESLRRSEERFRLMVEAVKDYAIFMLDPTGHVVTWNAGAERIHGYRAHEIVGQHFSKFYDPDEVRAGKCQRELEIAAREGRFEEEGWRIRKGGSRFWANVLITPLRDANHTLLGYAKVTRDLTERRLLEEERVRFVQAQEGIRLRDEFLSIVSHELKTPLAGLLLQIDALLDLELDTRIRERMERARLGGERLDALIESLLDVSRIATGRFVLSLERFDLVDLVMETVTSFERSAARVGSEIVVDAPPTLVGRWDHVRMAQVITNLLANALKYGARKRIHVMLSRDGSDVVLEVRDHGPGIDPTIITRVFERFERAPSTRHYGGLGIGLYVVREIVLAHGGTAVAENAQGGGARLRIRVPMETPT